MLSPGCAFCAHQPRLGRLVNELQFCVRTVVQLAAKVLITVSTAAGTEQRKAAWMHEPYVYKLTIACRQKKKESQQTSELLFVQGAAAEDTCKQTLRHHLGTSVRAETVHGSDCAWQVSSDMPTQAAALGAGTGLLGCGQQQLNGRFVKVHPLAIVRPRRCAPCVDGCRQDRAGPAGVRAGCMCKVFHASRRIQVSCPIVQSW